jgi:membrane-associated phospholipid phosphatase
MPSALVRADVGAYRAIRGAARTPATVDAVRSFSHLGEHAACWLALGAAGAALDRPHRSRWVRGLAAVSGAYVANVAIKAIVRRKRPVFDGLPALVSTPTKLSFPSSHATASFAAARAYSSGMPAPVAAGLYGVAGAMALSRVYLGVHYPSDVVAGAVLGTVAGSLVRA